MKYFYIGLLYLENPEQNFVEEGLKLMKFKNHNKIKILYINRSDREDEELKKLILFSILKPVDFMIIAYDFNKSKLIKFKDSQISNNELIDRVLKGKQEVFYYK